MADERQPFLVAHRPQGGGHAALLRLPGRLRRGSCGSGGALVGARGRSSAVDRMIWPGRVVVVLMVVITVLAGDGVLELAHARAELTPERGQPLGTEDDQHDRRAR